MPRVSIGLPTYNRPAGLRRALERITAQTHADLEVIVSDNASGAETRDVIESFAHRDPRISYIRQAKNIGANANFQFVLSRATAPYFAWVTDDDDFQETFIGELVSCMESHPEIALAMCDLHWINTDSPGKDTMIELESIRIERCLQNWESVRRVFFAFPTSNVFLCIYGLYRTDVLRRCNLRFTSRWRNYYFGAELPFLAELSTHGMIASIPKPLKTYVTHEQSHYAREIKSISRLDKLVRHMELRAKMSNAALRARIPLPERLRLAVTPWRSAHRDLRKLVRPAGAS